MKKTYHQKIKEKKMFKFGKNILSVIVLIFFFAVGWYGFRCVATRVCGVPVIDRIFRHNLTITMPNGAITAEIADTQSSRELGLSGRKVMEANHGLLFVFDVPGRYGFWMKDMLFPLDIIWINQDGLVVEVERNVKPESYPKTFINTSPASFVLEINAGKAEEEGVFIGSKVKIIE